MLPTASRYHAHVYFTDAEAEQAKALHELATRELAGRATVWPMHMTLRLFHPRPMFEIEFPHADREPVLAWVMANHGEFPVLLHPETDDPLRDHFVHAAWLGERLALDRDMFLRVVGSTEAS